MDDKQIKEKFKETYPDFMRGDEPLSPYFDIWEYAIEIATNTVVVEHFEAYGQCRDSRRIADLENQVEQMKKCLKGIIYMAESGLHTKNELAFARLIAEAKVFLRSKI